MIYVLAYTVPVFRKVAYLQSNEYQTPHYTSQTPHFALRLQVDTMMVLVKAEVDLSLQFVHPYGTLSRYSVAKSVPLRVEMTMTAEQTCR